MKRAIMAILMVAACVTCWSQPLQMAGSVVKCKNLVQKSGEKGMEKCGGNWRCINAAKEILGNIKGLIIHNQPQGTYLIMASHYHKKCLKVCYEKSGGSSAQNAENECRYGCHYVRDALLGNDPARDGRYNEIRKCMKWA